NAKHIWLIIAIQAESDSCVSCVLWGHWGVLGHNEDGATGELVSLDSALHPNVA
ncbi:Integrin alpha-IIb, partial [Clarias magur]